VTIFLLQNANLVVSIDLFLTPLVCYRFILIWLHKIKVSSMGLFLFPLSIKINVFFVFAMDHFKCFLVLLCSVIISSRSLQFR
jgi:hypothetical protein